MTFESRNIFILVSVHPALRFKLEQLLDLLRLRGEDILLTSGYRSIAEQNVLYAKGRTTGGTIVTNAKGGSSLHNYGLAVDFCPVGPLGFELKGKLEWTATKRYEAIGKLAKSIGLEWGGDWKQADRPHLQLSEGLTIAQLKKGQRPDSLKSLKRLKEYYQRQIDNAKRAMPKVDFTRKYELQYFIDEITEKLNQL